MTTQQAVVGRNRRPREQHPNPRDPDGRGSPSKKLPEYLGAHQVETLIRAVPNPRTRLLFLIEWRAGLRISEALVLEARDLSLEDELPSLHVREGKGSKLRIVPVHSELRAALSSALEFCDVGQGDRLVRSHPATSDRWIKKAAARAMELGVISVGRRVSNHAGQPTIPDAVMNYDNLEDIRHPVGSDFFEPDCSPHPFDVMAIFSLYQRPAR